RPIDSRRLVPMRPAGQFMHGASLLVGGEKGSWMNALLPMRRAAQGPGRARTCRLGRASSRDPTTKAAAWTVGSRLKRVYARLRRAMDARPNLRPRVDQEAKSHNRKGFWPTDRSTRTARKVGLKTAPALGFPRVRRISPMKRILLASAAILTLAATPALPQQKTIKIGFISTFSGPPAAIGNDMRNSFELALDHHGRKIGGLPVEGIYQDDQTKPQVGGQKTQKLTEDDRGDFGSGFHRREGRL